MMPCPPETDAGPPKRTVATLLPQTIKLFPSVGAATCMLVCYSAVFMYRSAGPGDAALLGEGFLATSDKYRCLKL